MAGVELATAYISLVPSLKGANASIAQSLAPEAAAAGIEGGSRLGSGLVATAAKFAAPLAAVLGLHEVFKTGFDEAKDAAAGTAQLAAGIQSTGNAANVTVDGLNALASNIQNYSGQTDDSIVKTEQLLLTFTNIKNTGTDKIFDDTTKAAADMAAKMGGDASQSAIQLGKALNDPVKGITALQRVGVSFTDAQKKTIQSMVDTGNVAGAQRVILNELNKEFGGAAEAAGKTFPGEIQRLHRAFEDFSQGLVQGFLPVLSPVLEGAIGLLHMLTDATTPVAQGIADMTGAAEKYLGGFMDGWKNGVDAIGSNQSMIAHWGAAAYSAFGQASLGYSHFIDGWKFGVDAVGTNQSMLAHWGAAAYGVFGQVSLAYSRVVQGFTTGIGTDPFSILGARASAAVGVIQQAFGTAKIDVEDFFAGFRDGTSVNAVSSLGAKVGDALKGIDFHSIFASIGSVVQPVVAAFGQLIPTIAPLIPQFLSVWSAFNPLSLLFHALLPVLPQVSQLIGSLAGNLITTLGGALTTIVPALADAALTITESLSGAFQQLIPAIGPILTTLIGAITQLVPLIGAVVSSFAPLMAQVLPIVVGLFTSLLPPIIQLVTTILPPLIQLGMQVAQTVFGAIAQILPIVASAITSVVGTLSGALGILVPVIGQVIAAVLPLVGALISQLVPVIVQLVSSVLPPVVTIFNAIISAIVPLITTILGLLVPVIQGLMPVVTTVFGVIANVIGSVMQIVMGIIQVVTGIISGNWDQVWNGILNILSGVWNTIVAVVTGVLSIVGSVIMGALAFIGGIWNDAWNGISSFFGGIWDGLVSGVSTGIDNIMRFLGGLPGKITGFFAGAGNWLVDMGRNLIQGLIDGIAGMSSFLTSALLNLLPQPLKDLAHSLGIASPSKLMRDQIGRWIPAGLVAGIEGGKDDVADSVRNLVAIPSAMSGSAARNGNAAPARASGSGMTVNQTINQVGDPVATAVAAQRRLAMLAS